MPQAKNGKNSSHKLYICAKIETFMLKTILLSLISTLTISANTWAQNTTDSNQTEKMTNKRCYWANNFDGMIFSTALIDNNGNKSLATLRFTAFLNLGVTYNVDLNKNASIYTGFDIKNIGLIEKYSAYNTTIKQRVYTAGVPVGIRLGNLSKKNFFLFGGGLDIALHYKLKFWNSLQSKIKTNDWFSKNSELLLPYIFAGFAIKGTSLKFQYYPGNFIKTNNNPLYGYNSNFKNNLLLISIGRDIKYSKN